MLWWKEIYKSTSVFEREGERERDMESKRDEFSQHLYNNLLGL